MALTPAAKTALQAKRDNAQTELSARAAVGDRAGAAKAAQERQTALNMAAIHHDSLT